MNYEDKDYIDASPPDGFDSDSCPFYQSQLSQENQERIKLQLKQIIENENDNSKRDLDTSIIY